MRVMTAKNIPEDRSDVVFNSKIDLNRGIDLQSVSLHFAVLPLDECIVPALRADATLVVSQ